MKYFVGIDGGGTGTSITLGNHQREIIGSIDVGPTNYHSVGLDKTEQALSNMFISLASQYEVEIQDIEAICFCGAGIDCKEDEIIVRELFRAIGYQNDLLIYNDSVGALVGANKGKHGAILISGTGSIALGISEQGEVFRVGGWGHLVDDLGSAYAISRDALKKILEAYDGREKKTSLWDGVKEKLGIKREDELVSFIYNPSTKKQDIAALAPFVIEAYEKDEIAKKIIDKAVGDLEHMIVTLAKRMNDFQLDIRVSGSVLNKNKCLRQLLIDRITNRYPSINIDLPLSDAATGALILAWDIKKIEED